jgi:hypothetical protein
MIRGSCLCGEVRYRIDGAPFRMSHCHCSMCRKAHGAAYGTYLNAQAKDFAWESGAAAVAAYESSPGVRRTFCARCGSTLQWLWDRTPEQIGIAAGTLDDDPGIRPAMHIFTASRAPWHELCDDGLPRWPESDRAGVPPG